MRDKMRAQWRVWLTILVTVAIPVLGVGASASSAAFDGGSGFERLAASVGRVDAWHALSGDRTSTSPYPYPRAALPPGQRPTSSVVPTQTLTHTAHLPIVLASRQPLIESRALWVTRYDWTALDQTPAPEAIDAIVLKASSAGFNTIFFQVRGAGDAYYEPGLEPWAARLTSGPVSETLGVHPGWDPLAHMLEAAHGAGLEVHAYVNVYTAWLAPPGPTDGRLWPPATDPPSMFDRFTYGPTYADHPGVYGMGYGWRHYDPSGPMALSWGQYLWASPGVDEVQTHLSAMIADIVARYPVEGVHLDRVRYAGPNYSYDPASNQAAGEIKTPARDQWQRERITSFVRKAAEIAHDQDVGMSTAVWPYALDRWEWGVSEGYSDYYQDAKGWARAGDVDVIVPMMYGGLMDDLARWEAVLQDFAEDPGLTRVYPGLGGYYPSFDEIVSRIELAREAGASGHAVFSFSGVDQLDYWDDFADGPYRDPALPSSHPTGP